MKTFLKKIFVLMSMLAFTLTSCNNEPSFDENPKAENNILQIAKDIVNKQDGNVPLPTNGGNGVQSRSAMSLITNATPLWDYVKYYNIDGMNVLMVELQTAEKVYSRITATRDGITTTQENETFSRLVIRKKGSDIYAHVLTYMPEEEYATTNQAKLDTIGYYPKYVDFTGITLTSNLDGSVFRGVRYENGHVAGIITKPQHTDCDHDHGNCTHSHATEHRKPISINLFSQSSQEPLSRATTEKCLHCRGEVINNKCQSCGAGYGQECPNCKYESLVNGFCLICYYEADIYSTCNAPFNVCICGNYPCPSCGNYKCTCGLYTCQVCGKKTCQCEPSDITTPPHSNTEENTPILFSLTSNSDAIFAIRDMPLMMKTQDGMASLTAIMTFIDNELFWGMRTVSEFDAYYESEFNGLSIAEGVKSYEAREFVEDFFSTTTFDTFQFAIEDRNVVISTFPGSNSTYPHFVLIVGRESDGDLVYLDPYDGEAYILNENRFENCEQIVVRIIQ